MLTKTQLKILSYLIDNKEKLAGIRELAKEISIVYYLVQRNIHDSLSKPTLSQICHYTTNPNVCH